MERKGNGLFGRLGLVGVLVMTAGSAVATFTVGSGAGELFAKIGFALVLVAIVGGALIWVRDRGIDKDIKGPYKPLR